MGTVNIHQAKTHLSRLIEQAAAGQEVVISKAGKPVAKLVGLKGQAHPRKPGALKGRIKIHRGFDRPMSAAELRAWYGGKLLP